MSWDRCCRFSLGPSSRLQEFVSRIAVNIHKASPSTFDVVLTGKQEVLGPPELHDFLLRDPIPWKGGPAPSTRAVVEAVS